MHTLTRTHFTTIKTEGGILPVDLLRRVATAEARGQELLDAHRRVRIAGRIKGVKHEVRAHLPPDVLGMYALLPMNP